MPSSPHFYVTSVSEEDGDKSSVVGLSGIACTKSKSYARNCIPLHLMVASNASSKSYLISHHPSWCMTPLSYPPVFASAGIPLPRSNTPSRCPRPSENGSQTPENSRACLPNCQTVYQIE